MDNWHDNYKVVITKDALKDIAEIDRYISCVLQAPLAAKNICSKIRKAILSLEYYPKKYAAFTSLNENAKGYRRIVVDNYLIVYIIDGRNVIVTNIFYGASDVITKLHQ